MSVTWLWIGVRTDAQEERFSRWLRFLSSENLPLAIVEAGAGKAVATVRYRSESLAGRLGATLIRINPRDHMVPQGGHISLPLGAAEGINGILQFLERARTQGV